MAAQKLKKQKAMAKAAHEKTAVHHRLHFRFSSRNCYKLLILTCVCLLLRNVDYNFDNVYLHR